MVKHLIALDLDGTVLQHGSIGKDHLEINVDPELSEVIQTLHRKGHEVVIATGRSSDATLPVVEALRITPKWVVAANGAVTHLRDPLATRAYRKEYVEAFDATDVLKTLRPQIGTADFAVETAEGTFLYTAPIPAGTLPSKQRRVQFDELLGVQATRVVVVSPEPRLQDFISAAKTIGLQNVSYEVGNTTWLDIAPVGITKASALEVIARKEGIDRAHIFAAGDGQNDISMLRWAARHGVAVAMGQAQDEVKNAATEVTGTITDNGLLTALKKHFASDLV